METAICLHCKRKIKLDKWGRFHRHMIKGTRCWCDGIFDTPSQQAAQPSVQADGLESALFGESDEVTLSRDDERLTTRRASNASPFGGCSKEKNVTESRQQYIERMAAIAVKMNWQKDDFEWLNNHLGKNDLVVEIEKSA